jgi:hypothetical protein
MTVCKGTSRVTTALTGALAAVLLPCGSALADHRSAIVYESLEISDFYVFNSDQKVDGATILTRDYNNNVIDVSLSIAALDPDTVYSIWVAVFNNPRFCSNDDCGLDDIPGVNPAADARVHPSVFYGGGFIADGGGNGHATFKIVPGRTARELFGGTKNYGLERVFGPDIHIVLRTHGHPVTGSVAKQLGTASSTCNTLSGMCQNAFASFHPPLE